MVRWEYAFLDFSYRAKHDETNDRWTWVMKATLSMRARVVARWKTENPSDADFSEPAVWSPVGDAPPEHAVEVQGPLDHLGDMGWELVSAYIASSALRTGSDIGWRTTHSAVQTERSVLKRPQLSA